MYAITGITGKVGGALARALLADRRPFRAVIRDIEKGRFWASQGCEIARGSGLADRCVYRNRRSFHFASFGVRSGAGLSGGARGHRCRESSARIGLPQQSRLLIDHRRAVDEIESANSA